MPVKSKPSEVSRDSVQVVLRARMSTSPDCSAVKRACAVVGTKRTLFASLNSARRRRGSSPRRSRARRPGCPAGRSRRGRCSRRRSACRARGSHRACWRRRRQRGCCASGGQRQAWRPGRMPPSAHASCDAAHGAHAKCSRSCGAAGLAAPAASLAAGDAAPRRRVTRCNAAMSVQGDRPPAASTRALLPVRPGRCDARPRAAGETAHAHHRMPRSCAAPLPWARAGGGAGARCSATAARRRCATATPCPSPTRRRGHAAADAGLGTAGEAGPPSQRGEDRAVRPATRHAACPRCRLPTCSPMPRRAAPLALLDGGELTDRRTAAASTLAGALPGAAGQPAAAGAGQRQGRRGAGRGLVPPASRSRRSRSGARRPEQGGARWRRGWRRMACRRAPPPRPIRAASTSSPPRPSPTRRWCAAPRCDPGTHVDLVGAFRPTMRESDARAAGARHAGGGHARRRPGRGRRRGAGDRRGRDRRGACRGRPGRSVPRRPSRPHAARRR